MLLRAPEPVLLLIADITGYTTYLVGTEIDHAQNVLEDLLETVVARLQPPLTLVKVEGDACFMDATGGTVSGSLLLDTIDAAYFAFRRRLRDVTQSTTCECNACIRIPQLDLKFVAHAGEAVRQTSFGREDLVGPDVIAVHRLLKNHVTEQHGWRGYALLTEAATRALGLDCPRLGMRPHHEEYDVGALDAFVEDLDERWRAEQQRSAIRVTPEAAWWRADIDVTFATPIVWEWVTSPRLRPRWATWIVRVDQETLDGRPGVGTTNHCVHGRDATLEEVLDYRPFETLTLRSTSPLGPILTTFDFKPVDGATHVTALCAISDTLKARLMSPVARRVMDARFRAGLERLPRVIAEASVDSALARSSTR